MQMPRRNLVLFLAIASSLCVAQQPLTNDSILKMTKAGLGEDLIVSTIQGQPGTYSVSPEDLIALKSAGVTDRELAAMVRKGTPPTAAAPAAQTNDYEDLEVGVYYQVNGAWTMIPNEQVNWKSGGFLKMVATDGIVKGDINGRLKGPGSPTKMTTPLHFLVKTPDGVEAKDFQLVHLHLKSNAREFRTVTGGVFHSSGGTSRDAIRFDESKLAKYTYEIKLTVPLPSGEYAFLAPYQTGATGKAYTFSLSE